MPFGHNLLQRISALQGHTHTLCPQEDEEGVIYGLENIIGDDVFEEFHERLFESTYKNASSARRANFDFEKIHNRALFDGFNEAVNWFRPYYAISSFVLI